MGRDGACSRRMKEELVFVERLAESKCGMQRCETLQFYDARPVCMCVCLQKVNAEARGEKKAAC